MRTMCCLVAMLVTISVASLGSDQLSKKAESETSMDDVIRSVRQDPDQVLCGKRPAMRSKRQADTWITMFEEYLDPFEYEGARPLRRGEAPWSVNIYAANGNVCGGAIIGEYWVVTSASCAIPYLGKDRSWLTVGDMRPGILEDGEQRFGTAIVIPHPRYRPEIDHDYNIALVKVAATPDGRGIRFNRYVQPICLPDDTNDILPKSTELLITGLPETYDENMLCAFKDDFTQRRRCHGREGFPAAYKYDDFYILAGIRSVNNYCNLIILANLMTLTYPWIKEGIVQGRSNYNESVMPVRPDWEKRR